MYNNAGTPHTLYASESTALHLAILRLCTKVAGFSQDVAFVSFFSPPLHALENREVTIDLFWKARCVFEVWVIDCNMPNNKIS